MSRSPRSRRTRWLGLGLALGLTAGCGGPGKTPPARDTPGSSAGEKVYRIRCRVCHAVNGVGGRMGPDLSFVGSHRDRAYLRQYILDPRGLNPDTEMPPTPLAEADLASLLKYLETLREPPGRPSAPASPPARSQDQSG